MGKLTGTQHSDAANELLGFYMKKAHELEEQGQYFMAAIALAFGIETAIITYILVETYEENGDELKIPDNVNFFDLINAANENDVLSAPINTSSHIREDDQQPNHIAKDVVDQIRKFRNLIHPAVALRERYDPSSFTKKDLEKFKDMSDSVLHSLVYYL